MPSQNRFAEWLAVGRLKPEERQPAFNLLRPMLHAPGSKPVTRMDRDLYTKNFGFFCKKELQVDKATKIPLRIRVGSLEQCNRLEEKY
ncbi:MAG: hypothetical protein ABW174_15810, partial [Flavitalea sp.]